MPRIFVTGSSDGLGQFTAQRLISQGHQVVLHARSSKRAADAEKACPGAEATLIGDLSSIEETKRLAAEANSKFGTFDAVIHNAALGFRHPATKSADGINTLFAVNSLAPFILTALMNRPKSLIYVSSSLHRGGDPSLTDLTWTSRRYNGHSAYGDSKLQNVLLAFAVARHWPDVASNALDPGWVSTKMGGASAPDSWEKGVETQIYLASGGAGETGKYLKYKKVQQPQASANDVKKQEEFLKICEEISGVMFPRSSDDKL